MDFAITQKGNRMDDTISRQAAIKQAVKESQADGAYGYMDTKSIVDMLNALPSAQPEQIARDIATIIENEQDMRVILKNAEQPKRGKWIDMGDFEQCSACTGTHLKEVNTVYGKAIWIKTPFCPNCGAEMSEGGEDAR